jgi:hypothetical protein
VTQAGHPFEAKQQQIAAQDIVATPLMTMKPVQSPDILYTFGPQRDGGKKIFQQIDFLTR